MTERVRVGTADELRAAGRLSIKLGGQPVCVLWSEDRAYAIDDRCPHMGFPLHRGSVEEGLLTCHWHHARFDLESGGTLDPFADDVRTYPVEVDREGVFLLVPAGEDPTSRYLERLAEGLEHGLALGIAKAVLGLLDTLGPEAGTAAALGVGVDFGTRYRDLGWGAGLTVLTAVANVVPVLRAEERALALVHGLVFVSRDTVGRPPRFPLRPLGAPIPSSRLTIWYRRFVDTRNGDAAERTLATAVGTGAAIPELVALLGSAATDHAFIDGGHVIDFTNKAFEMLEHLGPDRAGQVLTTLAQQTAGASRSEELGSWRHPQDLTQLLADAVTELPGRLRRPAGRSFAGDQEVDALAWEILGEDPATIVGALNGALERGATLEELARAVAYAASLRLTRFHTQNDHGDWDVVHHGFTSANAVHQLVLRAPTPELARGVYQGAMRVFVDRFLNVPPARPPGAATRADASHDLSTLQSCWDQEGRVDEAGAVVYAWIRSGGGRPGALAALGAALLAEDAGFHWFQTYEAAARQSACWPEGSEQQALILAGAARFLAAHTPTRRELSQVVRVATRLRRGEVLFEQV